MAGKDRKKNQHIERKHATIRYVILLITRNNNYRINNNSYIIKVNNHVEIKINFLSGGSNVCIITLVKQTMD